MWRFLTRTLKDFGNFFKQIAVKIVVAIIVGINLSTSYGTFISFCAISFSFSIINMFYPVIIFLQEPLPAILGFDFSFYIPANCGIIQI